MPSEQKVVYKYQIQESVELPVGAEMLQVDVQNGNLVFWALVDPTEKERLTVRFQVHMTGRDFTHDGNYHFFGTCSDSQLVFHVFVSFEGMEGVEVD